MFRTERVSALYIRSGRSYVGTLPTNYDFNSLLEDEGQSHAAKLARPFILTAARALKLT